MEKNMPVLPAIQKTLTSITCIILLLFLFSSMAYAQTYSVACPTSKQVALTFDGYPAFYPADCFYRPDKSWYQFPVYSNDGKNTYPDASCGGNPANCGRTDGIGYQCFELAGRYMAFRWGTHLYGGLACDLCPGGKGGWTPPGSAVMLKPTDTPYPGDAIVFSPWSGHTCGTQTCSTDSSGNTTCSEPEAGHIAVVDSVDTTTIHVTEQNSGPSGKGAYSRSNPHICGFIHSLKNCGNPNNYAEEPMADMYFNTGISLVRDREGNIRAYARGLATLDDIKTSLGLNFPSMGQLFENIKMKGSNRWLGWMKMCGGLRGDPVAAVDRNGDINVVYVGMDGFLWYMKQTTYDPSNNGETTSPPGASRVTTGVWTWPTPLGGLAASNPRLVKRTDGNLELFFVNGDKTKAKGNYLNTVWHIRQVGGYWGEEEPLVPGSYHQNVTHTVSIGTNQDGRLEVFYHAPVDIQHGSREYIYHMTEGKRGSWSAPQAIQPLLANNYNATSTIAVARNGDGRLQIFFRGGNDGVWTAWQLSPNTSGSDAQSWSQGMPIQEQDITSDIVALTLPQSNCTAGGGCIQIFYRGLGGGGSSLYTTWQMHTSATTDGTGNTWNPTLDVSAHDPNDKSRDLINIMGPLSAIEDGGNWDVIYAGKTDDLSDHNAMSNVGYVRVPQASLNQPIKPANMGDGLVFP